MLLDPAHLDPVAALGEDIADALFGRHQLALLVDHNAAERLGLGDLAAVGGEFAGQQFEQGGLAGAVGADQPDPVAALDAEREILDDGARTIVQVRSP